MGRALNWVRILLTRRAIAYGQVDNEYHDPSHARHRFIPTKIPACTEMALPPGSTVIFSRAKRRRSRIGDGKLEVGHRGERHIMLVNAHNHVHPASRSVPSTVW